MTTAEKLYTREEFIALPDDVIQGCELIDGRIVRKHIWDGEDQGMTPDMASHMQVVRLTLRALDCAAEQSGLGAAYTEVTFSVGGSRERTRRADVAVIYGELPTEPDALLALAPAMAVEVISPNNTAVDVMAKVEEYLAAGVQPVWLSFPKPRTIIAFWSDHTAVFRPGDTITAEPILPGFSCPVTDLFPPPATLPL
ncbi:MAG: Uma2 family endonuclease [Chloroflexota bacterium]|nr:Uma2 family endonuclease [Chloroflexota bacterium]MDE2961553.1 Uma2 family endonuclease [Chloroflexota bacterium]